MTWFHHAICHHIPIVPLSFYLLFSLSNLGHIQWVTKPFLCFLIVQRFFNKSRTTTAIPMKFLGQIHLYVIYKSKLGEQWTMSRANPWYTGDRKTSDLDNFTTSLALIQQSKNTVDLSRSKRSHDVKSWVGGMLMKQEVNSHIYIQFWQVTWNLFALIYRESTTPCDYHMTGTKPFLCVLVTILIIVWEIMMLMS